MSETEKTQRRYDRLAPLYDAMEAGVERLAFERWRERLWAMVQGRRVLEIGVGTGKNLPYHPAGSLVAGIDLSARMLARARQRLGEIPDRARLLYQMDAQRLAFADDVFDSAVATFVFCSVPLPVEGLQEIARVVRPGGQVLLLEHVRVDRPVIGPLMDVLDPAIVRVMGAHIARQTEENVRRAGLEIASVASLAPGELVKLIEARVRGPTSPDRRE
jgi:phosphatidylethanolamine/phosphatidyl-N-methylethanolamine N-methyltransferase